MRIPLDYYRILGVPTKATTAQITQAYRDRVAQLPRREHSELAIQARSNIIEQSYQVLSQGDRRAVYDNEFLNDTFQLGSQNRLRLPFQSNETEAADEAESNSPAIAIEQIDFLGGLLLLLELGEYELVLKLVPPYLKQKSSLVNQGLFGVAEVVKSELILCLALAYLELSREQWQQGRYESASESGIAGQKLLIEAGIFPSLRGEIQGDLDRLRPYQVLELVSQPESETSFRKKGLQLLQTMLDARGGIDGAGDDQSGLSMDDFLRFIQQLRSYLTVQEQQDLFVAESKRPSAVSTYLAVYALLAGGFADRQPEQIVKAKEKLLRLGKRQDVHLEQAICALLLGQTDEANQALDLSQEYEAIAYIRDNSQEAPDLLPGLCLYGEKWLKTEVFSHFRDLNSESVSLTEYFADDRVQQYLEKLPADANRQDWSIVGSESARPAPQTRPEPISQLPVSRPAKVSKLEPVASKTAPANANVTPIARPSAVPKTSTPRPKAKAKAIPLAKTPTHPPTKPTKKRPSNRSSRKPFPFKGMAILAGSLVALIFAIRAIAGLLGGNTIPDPLAVSLNTAPPLPIPVLEEPEAEPENVEVPEGEFDEAIAEQIIQAWLTSKTLAFGETHDTSGLPEVLTGKLLTTWVDGAREVEAAGEYRIYEHEALSIADVGFNAEVPDKALVVALITEKAQYFLPNGELDVPRSYDNKLRVRYQLIRKDNRWLIQTSNLLSSQKR